MRVSVPRISSIKLKEGGAKLYIIENTRSPECISRTFLSDAEHIASEGLKDIAGYAMVAWNERGDVRRAIRVNGGRWLGLNEAPQFVKDQLENLLMQTNNEC